MIQSLESLQRTRLLRSVTPESCQSLTEVWVFLLEPQAVEDGEGGARDGFISAFFFKNVMCWGFIFAKQKEGFRFCTCLIHLQGLTCHILFQSVSVAHCDTLFCQAEGLVFLLQNLPESPCPGQQPRGSTAPLDTPVGVPAVFLTAVAHSVMLNGHRNVMVKIKNYKLKKSQSQRREEVSC